METVKNVYMIILSVFGVLTFYKTVYMVIGFFWKAKKFPETNIRYTYGIVIAARNEELVIGQLIDSINNQDYPKALIKVFVIADNCTDSTAKLAKSKGAIVYERFNKDLATKGYALEFLFDCIAKDYGIESLDRYIVFDADNLLEPNFVTEMNKAFASGSDIVTSFRNCKNFDSNFISAAYGIHFYRSNLCSHRPRGILGVSTHLAGTGYGFKSELVKDGWHYTALTEDHEFTIKAISSGKRIKYCEAAEFHDEQPTDFKTVRKQRMRWTLGHMQNFFWHSNKLIKSLFKKPSFSAYDFYFHIFPYSFFSFIVGSLIYWATIVYVYHTEKIIEYLPYLKYLGNMVLMIIFNSLLIGLLALIKERKKYACKKFKLFIYWLLWVWFDLISLPLTIAICFKKVKWEPIKHKDTRSIHETKKTKDSLE